MHALIASIVLNTSLVTSLTKISSQSGALTTLPAVFLGKQSAFSPLYLAATINQVVLLGLCFAYFGFFRGIFAYILGSVIGLVADAVSGRLKWFGVYVYPVVVLILTVVAFQQIP